MTVPSCPAFQRPVIHPIHINLIRLLEVRSFDICVQEISDNSVCTRSVVVEVEVVRGVRVEVRHEGLRIAIIGARGLFVDAFAKSVADDIVLDTGNGLRMRQHINTRRRRGLKKKGKNERTKTAPVNPLASRLPLLPAVIVKNSAIEKASLLASAKSAVGAS